MARATPRPDGTERWSYLGGQSDADLIFSIPRPVYECAASGGAVEPVAASTAMSSFGTSRSLRQPPHTALSTVYMRPQAIAPSSQSTSDLLRTDAPISYRSCMAPGYVSIFDSTGSPTGSAGPRTPVDDFAAPREQPLSALPRIAAPGHRRRRSASPVRGGAAMPLAYSLADHAVAVERASQSTPSDTDSWRCYRLAGIVCSLLQCAVGLLLAVYCVLCVVQLNDEHAVPVRANAQLPLRDNWLSFDPAANGTVRLQAALGTGHCGLVLFTSAACCLAAMLARGLVGMALACALLAPVALAIGYDAAVRQYSHILQPHEPRDFWLQLALLVTASLLISATASVCTLCAVRRLLAALCEAGASAWPNGDGRRRTRTAVVVVRVIAMLTLLVSTAAMGTTLAALVPVAKNAEHGSSDRLATAQRDVATSACTCMAYCIVWLLVVLAAVGKRSKAAGLTALLLGSVLAYALLRCAPDAAAMLILLGANGRGGGDKALFYVLASLQATVAILLLVTLPSLACALI